MTEQANLPLSKIVRGPFDPTLHQRMTTGRRGSQAAATPIIRLRDLTEAT